jgi:hypothetical protein
VNPITQACGVPARFDRGLLGELREINEDGINNEDAEEAKSDTPDAFHFFPAASSAWLSCPAAS